MLISGLTSLKEMGLSNFSENFRLFIQYKDLHHEKKVPVICNAITHGNCGEMGSLFTVAVLLKNYRASI